MPTLLSLPSELLTEICRNLPKTRQAALMRTCRTLRSTCVHQLYLLDDEGTPDLTNALKHADRANDEPLMLRILDRSIATIKASSVCQQTALTIACRRGFQNAVRALLDGGIAGDTFGDDSAAGDTPFTVAVEAGHFAVMDLLVRHGADLGIYTIETSLQMLEDRPTWGQWLVDHGLGIRQRDNEQNSLLHVACESEDISLHVVRLLLDNGLDPNATNMAGHAPIYLAIGNVNEKPQDGIAIVNLLLQRGVAVNSSCYDGWSPLHIACELANLDAVQCLLNAGADPNRKHPVNGQTAVWWLAQRDEESLDILQLLLNSGYNLSTNRESIDALMLTAIQKNWMETGNYLRSHHLQKLLDMQCDELLFIGAASLGDLPMMRLLVERGIVDVNTQFETTALIEAARASKLEVVEFLINEAGFTNIDATDSTNTSALFAAIDQGQEAIIRILTPLAHFDNTRDYDGNTPLQEAVYNKSPVILELLVNRYMEINDPNVNYREELSWAMLVAVQEEQIDMARFILDKMVEAGLELGDSYAPTCEAIICQYMDIANWLIDRRVALEKTDWGHTPLTAAVWRELPGTAARLVACGVDLETEGPDGRALYAAVASGQIEIVKLLVSHGADLNAVWDGKTAIEKAVVEDHADIVRLLLEAGAISDAKLLQRAACLSSADMLSMLIDHKNANTVAPVNALPALNVAALEGKAHNVQLLLRAGVNPNQVDSYGQSPLMAAMKGGDIAIARMLLDAGADIHTASQKGSTALLWCASHSKPELVQLLIDNGARVNHVLSTGWYPLAGAVQACKVETARLLLANGADVSIPVPADGGKTAGGNCLHIAARIGEADLVEFLLDAGCDPLVRDSAGKTPLEVAANEWVVAALYAKHPAVV
ncbi:ankyrin repeat-containing domain protein [Aspergillus unguis]